MEKIREKITTILLGLSLVVFLFGSGYRLGEWQAKQKSRIAPVFQQNPSPKNLDFSLFWETWNTLEKKYIDKSKLDPKKMYYGAIKGMVSSLGDPYTFFLTPEENKESKLDLQGKFYGIGAYLGLKDFKIVVIAPLKDSPAEKAGLKAGDIIVKVNGESTEGWSLPKAVKKIRGPKGTKVELTVLRNGKLKKISIIRDEINVPSVEFEIERAKKYLKEEEVKNQKFAYVKLIQFGDNTNREWDKTAEEIYKNWKQGKIKGLILDLRDNPGGYLLSAVHIAEEFLPKGKLIVKQQYVDRAPKLYASERDGRLIGIPLVILVNQGSASASEILAGALQDYKVATLVGEKTFGKGSVQEKIDLSQGAGLHVTVAKWILPDGRWINGKGIEPDIKVELKTKEGNTVTKENDNQLKTALEQLFKK